MKPRKNKSGRWPVYEDSLKIAVARDYLSGNLSQTQLAAKYQLKNGEVVRGFVKWYTGHFETALSLSKALPSPAGSDPPLDVKRLEVELASANLKIAALEIMIEIAEKDLGIDIRKKRGTKQ